MATLDPQAPATKEDVSLVKKDVTDLKLDFSSLKQDVSGLRQDIVLLGQSISADMKTLYLKMHLEMGQIYENLSEDRTKRHFDVSVEKIRHDAFGSQKDKISLHDNALNDHGQRIVVLEKKCGVL